MIFVDFPAVLPVDSIKVEELVPYRKDAFIQLQKDGKTVKVVGNKYLSDAKVESIFKDAKTTTQALNDLRRAYVDAGHLLMKVDYFTNEEQIIFLVREYAVKKITGDESLVAYFEALQGESSLTYDEYETPRVRAEGYASRIGQQYKASYKVTGDKEVELQFTASDVEGHKDTMVFAEINNHGSRYSGEYNGKLGLTQTFDGGSRLTLLYGTPLAGLNEEDTGEMTQLVASLDYPTTYGFLV